jgi:hypothetical protein
MCNCPGHMHSLTQWSRPGLRATLVSMEELSRRHSQARQVPAAVHPAVVCALNGTPPASRAAAACAASLARALDWRLALVAGGLRPLEQGPLADAIRAETAGLVVQPVGRVGTAEAAGDLANRCGVPLVIVPRQRHMTAASNGPVVAPSRIPHIGGFATRVALALGVTLEFADVEGEDRAPELLRRGEQLSPRMLLMPSSDASEVLYDGLRTPVVFMPPPGRRPDGAPIGLRAPRGARALVSAAAG